MRSAWIVAERERSKALTQTNFDAFVRSKPNPVEQSDILRPLGPVRVSNRCRRVT